MKPMTASPAEDELTQLANRFAHWRQGRATRRARIPQALWDQAVSLTAVLPTSRVAKRLGLCPNDLKKRCCAPPATPAPEALPTALSFVEVSAASSWLATSAEVELHKPDGTRMRIVYHEPQPSLAALVRTFLEMP
jgi:hypothetical protein